MVDGLAYQGSQFNFLQWEFTLQYIRLYVEQKLEFSNSFYRVASHYDIFQVS